MLAARAFTFSQFENDNSIRELQAGTAAKLQTLQLQLLITRVGRKNFAAQCSEHMNRSLQSFG